MIECIGFSPVNTQSTCQGVATIRVHKWGVDISGISLHAKDGKRWINLPARIKEEDGVTKYYPYIVFHKKEHKNKFCEVTKKAIDVYNATPKNLEESTEEIPF